MLYTEFLQKFDLKKLIECFCDPDKEYSWKKLYVKYDEYDKSLGFYSNVPEINKFRDDSIFSISEAGILTVVVFDGPGISVNSLYKEDIFTDEKKSDIDYDKLIKTACRLSARRLYESFAYAFDAYRVLEEELHDEN